MSQRFLDRLARVVVLSTLASACASPKSLAVQAPRHQTTRAEVTACQVARAQASEVLAREDLTRCARDSECEAIAAPIGGDCGTFLNFTAWQTHRSTLEAQLGACASMVRILHDCPRRRAICEEGRCGGLEFSAAPEACAAVQARLKLEAAAANTCTLDVNCASVHEHPTSQAYAVGSVELQEQANRVCAKTFPLVTASRPRPAALLTCLNHRCAAIPAIAPAPLREPALIASPRTDDSCITRALQEAFRSSELQPDARVSFKVKVAIDAAGVMNQFHFLEPKLSEGAQQAVASRLHDCQNVPAQAKGQPVSVDYVVSLEVGRP